MNIDLIHSFPVDNMRVIEAMFHARYSDRVFQHLKPEWFHISDKVKGICQCTAFYVMDCLTSLSNKGDVYDWWWELYPKQRKAIIPTLWKHPLLKIEVVPPPRLERGHMV